MIKISIASTFYNDRTMLKRVMDSVLSQTYPCVEHCISDAGSTDGSVELVEEYEKKYQRAGKVLKWVSKRDKGRPDGMNRAVNMAEGDYIFVAFFDPFAEKTTLEYVASVLEGGDYDYVHGGVFFQRDGRIIRNWSGKKGNWRLGWMMATPTLCVKNTTWKKHGPFDCAYKTTSEDYKFQVSLFQDTSLKYTSLNKNIVVYFAGGQSNGGLKNKLVSIREAYRVLRERKVKLAWAVNLGKTIRGVCSYIFVIRRKIRIDDM